MQADNKTLKVAFEAELTVREVTFLLLDDGRYEIATANGPMTVSLDNLSRQFACDQDASAIARFVDTIAAGMAALPVWADAQDNIFPMIDSAAVALGDGTLTRPLTDDSQLVLVHFDAETGAIRFLRDDDAVSWAVSAPALWQAAEQTLARILAETEVSFIDAGDLRVGTIEAHEPHKASLIRATTLRAKVESELGWPIYAVAPSQDFVFLVSQSDADKLNRLGETVVKEYQTGEYPVSTEVWEISDDGITAIGRFPAGNE